MFLACLVATAGMVPGQSVFGTILGTVSDQQGKAMPAVEVTLTEQNTNIVRTTLANEQGDYEFLNLNPGTYRVRAGRAGFKTFVKADIALNVRQTVRVDPLMEVGAVTETVTVAATPGLIDTETSSLSGTISGGEVHFLSPTTDSQRPWTLMRLNPLVQNTNSGTRFSMGGAYYNQAEFQIDGISAPLGAGGPAASSLMSSEAVQEVKILAVNNSAEYASPGIFQQVSKGGGNVFHGDIYYYYNTPAGNARETTSTIKTSRILHMFGGNVNGPIRIPKLYNGRDHTFFSASWQSKREAGNKTYYANVPTLDMRNGYFPKTAVRDPLNGLPFSGETIPVSRFNPVSQFFQDNYFLPPTESDPTLTTNNYQIVGPPETSREEVLDLRLDHRISDKHWLYGRVGGTQFNSRAYESNLKSMGFRSNTRKLYTGAISYNLNLRADLLNEFRVGFTRDKDPAGGSNNGLEVVRAAKIQFPPYINPPDTAGFPVITISGLQPLSQSATTRRATPSYQLTNTLSWIKGRHTFKGGVNIFAEQPNYATIPSGAHGSFRFQSVYTGVAYADFLLGIPDQTTVTNISPNKYMRSTNYGLFFQDDFKIRPDLTLNLGLRWDYQGPIYNKNNALYDFDPASGGLIMAAPDTPVNPVFRARYKGIPVVAASQLGLPERTLHFADKNNFAPRIGFAWRPRNAASFVVRGAWGKFTDLLGQGLFGTLAAGGFLNRGNIELGNDPPEGKPGIMPATAFRFPYPFRTESPGETPKDLAVQGFDPHLINPYVQQWNLTLEKVLWEISFRASYLGTKSTNLVYTRDINQRITPGNDKYRPYYPNVAGSIGYLENGGSQIYHGFQFESRKRLSKGVMFQAGYVFSKNISDVLDQNDDDAKGYSTDSNNRRLDRGLVGYNRKHNLTATAVWELPLGRGHWLLGNLPGWANQIASGWELYPELFVGSGQYATPCRKTANPFTSQACASQTARPDRAGDGNDGPRLTGPGVQWFNINAFKDPAATVLGNSARNILEGPGFWHPSVSLTKKVRFRERAELWLSLVAMNVVNHPNYKSPSSTAELMVGNSAFGSTTSLLNTDRAADRARSRNMWLRARIVF